MWPINRCKQQMSTKYNIKIWLLLPNRTKQATFYNIFFTCYPEHRAPYNTARTNYRVPKQNVQREKLDH